MENKENKTIKTLSEIVSDLSHEIDNNKHETMVNDCRSGCTVRHGDDRLQGQERNRPTTRERNDGGGRCAW